LVRIPTLSFVAGNGGNSLVTVGQRVGEAELWNVIGAFFLI
jgi:hypothetical protein